MGLNVPDLDDRTFEDLLEDATRSIPVHTDEWTDHNESDPGITILEVLAWVAESDIYRLDRVTEIHVRKYLQLLGVQPRPPQSASTRLALSPDGTESGTEIEAGEALLADDGSGAARQFETTADLRLTEAEVAAVVSTHHEGQVDNTTANESDSMHFPAFGPAAEGGSAMYVGFDEDPFADADRLDLSIDFHDDDIPDPATHGPDPVAVPPVPPIGRRRADGDGADGGGNGGSPRLSMPEPVDFEPTVEVAWQHCLDLEDWFSDDDWAPVEVDDGTNAFYEGGMITLQKPGGEDGWRGERGRILDVDEPLFWLRCVVETPGHEVPPQLDTVQTNVVPVEHRAERVDEALTRPDGMVGPGMAPFEGVEAVSEPVTAWFVEVRDVDGAELVEVLRKIDEDPTVHVAINEDTGRHLLVGRDEQHLEEFTEHVERTHGVSVRIGESITVDRDAITTAEPDQTFVFDHAPVLEATVRVGGDRWTPVPDFAASGPDDEHYVLDHERGMVRFGDGVRGEVPEAGQPVVAEHYVHGGGDAGNVGFSAEWTFVEDGQPDVEIEQLAAARGGDTDSLGAALARLKRDLKRPYRLVTREDCQYVAKHTPGLRFGRTTVRVDEPDGSDEDRTCAPHGTLRVVVVPYSTRLRPEPSDGFLEAVRCHLQRHRLVTDRVEVEPPTYVGVRSSVGVELREGYAESRRAEAIQETLDEFLDPLSGFDGDGWPFGRPVYRSELFATIEGVEGVDCVTDLSISATGEHSMVDGDVHIRPTALVYSQGHDVRVRTPGGDCEGWSR